MAGRVFVLHMLHSTADALHRYFVNLAHSFQDMQFQYVRKGQQGRLRGNNDPVSRNPGAQGTCRYSQPVRNLNGSIRADLSVLYSLCHTCNPATYALSSSLRRAPYDCARIVPKVKLAQVTM